MRVSVSVVDGHAVKLSMGLTNAPSGDPLLIKAVKGGKLLLSEEERGFVPKNISVRRARQNLQIALEDFFECGGELVGIAEDAVYGDASAITFLINGVASPLVMAGGSERRVCSRAARRDRPVITH